MTSGKKSLNSFGNYFSAKCVSVLLTVFVFVAGMMVSNVAIAAPAESKSVFQLASLAGDLAKGIGNTITARKRESYKRLITFNDGRSAASLNMEADQNRS